MTYSVLKSLHLIFIVTWFSGIFYIVRLFIYHIEAEKEPGEKRKMLQDQFKVMERRLWFGITWPSAILTLLFGLSLLYFYREVLAVSPWIHLKLALVFGLYLYHYSCHRIFKKLRSDQIEYTSGQMRLWNEVATLFLVGIVFTVVLKDLLSIFWAMSGLLAFAGVLALSIGVYKKIREG